MPAPPPPPPPGPPLPSAGHQGGGDDGRSMLLESIRKGKALKKTTTVDRSAPPNAGKVCGSEARVPSNSSSGSVRGGSGHVHSKLGSSGGGSNGLMGGLMLDGIPKLRPTGRTLGDGTAGSIRSPHPPQPTPQRNDGASRRPFGGEVRNRGPPPQPPPANQKPTISTSASDSVLTGGSRSDGLNVSGSHSHLVGSASPPTLPSKPVINHGKPNVAPKPPGVAPNRPSPPPKKQTMNGSGRTPVTRTQSMRVPKSPPVAPPIGPVFPAGKELGKGPMAFHQSQDSLHCRTNPPPPPRTNTLPSNLNHHGGQKAFAPLPPSAPPPPAPVNRFMRPPGTRPPPPPIRVGGPMNPPPGPPPPPPPVAPPPPPPHHHRNSPAPPPPPAALQTRLAPASPSCAPPLPPTRNSSMRNGPAQTTSSDFDGRFGDLFHCVEEFPTPQQYRQVKKVYNSKNARQPTSQQAKQQAPQPPMVQLSGRMWSGDVSSC
ncbi:hypothetical protein R5R35_009653 [Gryllus longicercus]|uniref:WH2 domain-containing protein n=1 Tax=Gryllus longicercus TaxID=2509291 RepID=A0AAN9VIS6_9ORTH